MEIRGIREDDIEGYLDCEERIWESMSGILPKEYVEQCMAWNKRENVREAWKRVIAAPNWIALVAIEGGSVVGVIHGSVDWSRLSSLGFLGVDEDYRRRGIARGLVERFVEESRAKGAAKVSLETSPELRAAVKLYTEMGFVPEGFLKSHRMGLDIIVYSKFME